MRPFPIDIIPAHVYLSAEDQKILFGIGYPMTILTEHTQPGQLVYQEKVEVIGDSKNSLQVHVLGPNWQSSHVEVSSIEASYLGYDIPEARKGVKEQAAPCILRGPEGEVNLSKGLIVTKPHLAINVEVAEKLGLRNGQEINMEIQLKEGLVMESVIVRVHPTFSNRVEVHSDHARNFWLARQSYAKII